AWDCDASASVSLARTRRPSAGWFGRSGTWSRSKVRNGRQKKDEEGTGGRQGVPAARQEKAARDRETGEGGPRGDSGPGKSGARTPPEGAQGSAPASAETAGGSLGTGSSGNSR